MPCCLSMSYIPDLMQKSKRGPPAQLMTNKEDTHPYAADKDELHIEVNTRISARQSHVTTTLARHRRALHCTSASWEVAAT